MPSNYTKSNGTFRGKQKYKPDPNKFLYNIDTFWYNVEVENYDEVLEGGLLEKLIDGRNFNMDTDETENIVVKLPGYKNSIQFEIYGGQPPLYQFSIRNNDMAFYLSRKQREDSNPIKVQINQFPLWEKGIQSAFSESLQVLMALGMKVGKSKLNRADMAVHSDQFQWNLEDFTSFEYPRNFAKDNLPNWVKLDPTTGNFETVYFGSRNYLQLRIYDKSKEIEVKKKDHFTEMYKRFKLDPKRVWNIEFEVRREFLKDCMKGKEKIFDDLEAVFRENRFDILWSMMMERFNHPSAFWSQLKKGAKGKFEKVEHTVTRVKEIDWSIDREIPQLYGRLQKLLVNSEHDTLDQALHLFVDKAYQYEEQRDRDFSSEVNQKRRMYINETINDLINNTKLENRDKSFKDLPVVIQGALKRKGLTLENGVIKNQPNAQTSD